jgi:hypothetical protein
MIFTKEQRKQKFHKGYLVRVSKDLGPHMSHFTADVEIAEGKGGC